MKTVVAPIAKLNYKYWSGGKQTLLIDEINKALAFKWWVKNIEWSTILEMPNWTHRITEFVARELFYDIVTDGWSEFARLSKGQNEDIIAAINSKSYEELCDILSKEDDVDKRIQIMKLYFEYLPKVAFRVFESFIIYCLDNLSKYKQELKDIVTYWLWKKLYIQNYSIVSKVETLLIDDDWELISAQVWMGDWYINGIYTYTILTWKEENRVYNWSNKSAVNFKPIKRIH